MIWMNKVIKRTHSHYTTLTNYSYYNIDEVWLQIYNKERKKENLGQVSGDLFESIIDQLEKEWFDLVKILHCL
jgi:hypothetical protein